MGASDAVNTTLNYTKADYDAKINELEGYNNLLNGHLETLESLRDSIPTFWTDEQAEEAYDKLSKMIQKVHAASNRIETYKQTYSSASNSIDEQIKKNKSIFDNMDSAINSLT